jgi:Tetratricopeptide repeat
LADLYHALRMYAEAESLFKRALAIREKALGPGHPNVAIVLENYAALLRSVNRGAEADKLETRVKEIREKTKPK